MRKVLCIFIILCIIPIFAGCSGFSQKPDALKIMEDFSNNTVNAAFVNFETCEIIRQQTNEQAKQFIVDVNFFGRDEYANYQLSNTLVYNYYDDMGWMLDEFTDVFPTYECIKGRTTEEIIRDLNQNCSTYISNCTEISYLSHQFDANEKADIVKIEWTVDSNYLITKNTGYLEYVYSYGEWKVGEISKNDSVYKLKLEGTRWEPDFREYWNSDRPNNVDYIISGISNDSTVIIFQDNLGNSYTAKVIGDSYKEDFEEGYGIYYKFEGQTPYIQCEISGYNDTSYKNGPVIKMFNSTTQTQLDYNLNPLYYMKK